MGNTAKNWNYKKLFSKLNILLRSVWNTWFSNYNFWWEYLSEIEGNFEDALARQPESKMFSLARDKNGRYKSRDTVPLRVVFCCIVIENCYGQKSTGIGYIERYKQTLTMKGEYDKSARCRIQRIDRNQCVVTGGKWGRDFEI